jgi:hypothetical protein
VKSLHSKELIVSVIRRQFAPRDDVIPGPVPPRLRGEVVSTRPAGLGRFRSFLGGIEPPLALVSVVWRVVESPANAKTIPVVFLIRSFLNLREVIGDYRPSFCRTIRIIMIRSCFKASSLYRISPSLSSRSTSSVLKKYLRDLPVSIPDF